MKQFLAGSGLLILMICVAACSGASPTAAPPTAAPARTEATTSAAAATAAPAAATSHPATAPTATVPALPTMGVTMIAMPPPTDTPEPPQALKHSTLVPTALAAPRIYFQPMFGVEVEYRIQAHDISVSRTGDGFAWTQQEDGAAAQTDKYPGLVYVPSGNLLEQHPIDANHPIVLAVEASQEDIITGSADGSIEIWNVRTGVRDFAYGQVIGQPISIALSADESLVAVGVRGRYQGGDGSVTVWKKGNTTPISILPSYGAVTRVAFAPDNTLYFSTDASSCGRGGGGVFAWDGVSEQAKLVVSANGNPVIDFAIQPGGKLIATAGQNGSARCIGTAAVSIWETATGKLRQVLPQTEKSSEGLPLAQEAASLAFSPDETVLAVGDTAGNLSTWDWKSGKVLGSQTWSTSTISRVFWLANHTLFLNDRDGYVRLIEWHE